MCLLPLNSPYNYVAVLELAGALTYPCQVWLSKAGGGFVMSPTTGTHIGNAGNFVFVKIAFLPADLDTLGGLGLFVSDGFVAYAPIDVLQVVTALPGDPGQLTVAERLAVAIQAWQLNDGIELGLTPQNALRVAFAVLAGKSTVDPPILDFRNFGDTKNRVHVQYDVHNQRIFVTYDFT